MNGICVSSTEWSLRRPYIINADADVESRDWLTQANINSHQMQSSRDDQSVTLLINDSANAEHAETTKRQSIQPFIDMSPFGQMLRGEVGTFDALLQRGNGSEVRGSMGHAGQGSFRVTYCRLCVGSPGKPNRSVAFARKHKSIAVQKHFQ